MHQRRDDDGVAGFSGGFRSRVGELPFVGHPHSGVEVHEPAEHAQHVLLAPHHTLGHSGGSARVEDVDVVVGARFEVSLRTSFRERVLVRDRTDVGGVDARAVVDRDEVSEHRQRLAHCRDTRRVLRVVHERDQIGVVEQVPELGLDVPVVHVDRNGPQLVRREDRLDERVAVHAIDADVVAGPDSLSGEVMRQPVGPLLELCVRSGFVGDDQRDSIGNAVNDMLGEICDVPGHPASIAVQRAA